VVGNRTHRASPPVMVPAGVPRRPPSRHQAEENGLDPLPASPYSSMTTYKLRVEYDGTAYAGWQRQPGQPTIQAAIEDALARITRHPISAVAAGRTDAGVHATGQVVSFRSEKSLSSFEWTRALNGILPKDIGILHTETVDDAFHARYDAYAKIYEYRILNQTTRPALDRLRVWQIAHPLDVDRMRQASCHLLGQHDCTSFQGSPTDVRNPVCTIQLVHYIQEGPLIRVTIQADRFLKQMVRALLGTLVEIGHHKRTPDDLITVLEARDRRTAGPTAPPQGLYRRHVLYHKEHTTQTHNSARP